MCQVIHIGMYKTGSSWLQDEYFPHHPQLAIVGSRMGDPACEKQLVNTIGDLVHASDLAFDRARFRDTIRTVCERYSALRRQTGMPVDVDGISHENLCGKWPTGHNSRFIAEELAACFPEAKVIIFVRSQPSMLASMYRQYIRHGGVVTFREFLQNPGFAGAFTYGDSPWNTQVVEFLKYSRLVRTYQKLFGPERVLVDCQERLRFCKEEVLARMEAFLGISALSRETEREANIQLSDIALGWLRFANRFLSTRYRPHVGSFMLSRLIYWIAKRSGRLDWTELEPNPYWIGQRVHVGLQRRLADGVLPAFDRAVFQKLMIHPRDLWRQLPGNTARWLEELYAEDNVHLQKMVPWEIQSLGFPWPGQADQHRSRVCGDGEAAKAGVPTARRTAA